MEYGKKYRVLDNGRSGKEFVGHIVERIKRGDNEQRVIFLTELSLKSTSGYWLMNDYQVELIPEELQNESLEVIKLYYSL